VFNIDFSSLVLKGCSFCCCNIIIIIYLFYYRGPYLQHAGLIIVVFVSYDQFLGNFYIPLTDLKHGSKLQNFEPSEPFLSTPNPIGWRPFQNGTIFRILNINLLCADDRAIMS